MVNKHLQLLTSSRLAALLAGDMQMIDAVPPAEIERLRAAIKQSRLGRQGDGGQYSPLRQHAEPPVRRPAPIGAGAGVGAARAT